MKKAKKNNMLFILIIAIFTITIGFALLSTTLGIYGVSKIANSRWNIKWDDTSIEESGTAEVTTGAHIVDTENTVVEFAADFEAPGDYYELTIDAKNDGTIDGTLIGIVKGVYESDGETTKTLPEYLEYTITYDDGTTPASGDVLRAGGSQKYKVRLAYKEDATSVIIDEDITKYKIEINYQQITE